MLGAILGDIIGRPYEFKPIKTKDFPLFSKQSGITDDSIMTIAVAQGLLEGRRISRVTSYEIKQAMRRLGRQFPHAGYGSQFRRWLKSENPEPYNSFGNGSAMRVSPVAWFFDDLEDTERFATISADVTHNHPEGIKGAQSVAAAIFLARTGATKNEIRLYIEESYGYDLSRSIDRIRPDYRFDVTCQGSVPEAIIAFLESTGFEDAIRNAVSLGGDADTQAAIAGSIAEAFYGVDNKLKEEAIKHLEKESLSLESWFAEVPIVTASSWYHMPLPEKKMPMGFQGTYTKDEYLRMSRGWLPHEMEDKWFIFEENGWLNFHRSWTGYCIYRIHLAEKDGCFKVDRSWVNRDESQYSNTSFRRDQENLLLLVDNFLLGRIGMISEEHSDFMSQWHYFGNAIYNGLSKEDVASLFTRND